MFQYLSVSQLGLLVDILGALLLFLYGLPSKVRDPNGPALAIGLSDQEVKEVNRKNKNITRWAHIGAILLVIGFLLQFIGSYK